MYIITKLDGLKKIILNLTPFKQVTHALIIVVTDKHIKKSGDMWSRRFLTIW